MTMAAPIAPLLFRVDGGKTVRLPIQSKRPRKPYHTFGAGGGVMTIDSGRPDWTPSRKVIGVSVGWVSTEATREMLSHGGIAVAAPICSRHWMDAVDSDGGR